MFAPDSIAVLVVDDERTFRELMQLVVARVPGMTVVGEACCGESALELSAQLAPDLVIMDVQMPGMDGIEAARRLKSARPGTVVLLVSAACPEPVAALACGAATFLRKERLSPGLLRELWLTYGRAA